MLTSTPGGRATAPWNHLTINIMGTAKRGRALPQTPLRPFGDWNKFNGFNHPVTGQLERGDDGGGQRKEHESRKRGE